MSISEYILEQLIRHQEMWVMFLALLCSGSVSALTDAEVKEQFIKQMMSCLGEHPVEMFDLLKLQKLELPDKPEVKCLLACTYRKIGTLTSEGMIDLKKSYELAEKTKQGDENAISNGKKVADICVKVNDEPVSDGKKGCERAALNFKCFVDVAPKYGFTVM